MKKIKTIILSNEQKDDHSLWVKACEAYKEKIEYRVVNLTSNNWLEEIQKESFDVLLAKPGGLTAQFKQQYDERVYILSNVLGYEVYPTAKEIFIYENKRFLSYWLKANNIEHPTTHVFYSKKEAINLSSGFPLPLVGKTNIGASGSGVNILSSRHDLKKYINTTFSGQGTPKRAGPNFQKPHLLKRGMHYIWQPRDIFKKLGVYKTLRSDVQKSFCILQEYVPHTFEWRVVRIGDSFFAHKKLTTHGKASGSLLKNYDNPPFSVLDYVNDLTDRFDFRSMAVDLFETKPGNYLVNEMQCIFGQSDPYQMLVDNKPGRYIYKDRWIFEEGGFASNECYDLRLEYILQKYQ